VNEIPRPFPQILAPAGNKAGFLAALAAGAEAVYCGLKNFSARMEAKNFTLEELAGLADLAHRRGTQVYVTFNTLIKPDELDQAGRLVRDLERWVHPDALIVQDLSLVELSRQVGFSGELHLSTLAHVGFGEALSVVSRIKGVSRIVLPRELGIDEIKRMALACPEGFGLEVFVHGALCFGVSGRCYWSSFLGGKSGLRGRCVQPCRRLYKQDLLSGRVFSCLDLSLGSLAKVLLSVPAVKAWKIEGRKKSPHYVYNTVRAYRLLRDHSDDAHLRKEALSLLDGALGRAGTHYCFLSHRPQNPIQIERQTGSGLLLGDISGRDPRPSIVLKQELFPGDVLRVGYEDEPWHRTLKVTRSFAAGQRFYLPSGPRQAPQKGAPVFLTDRRQPDLYEKIAALEGIVKPSGLLEKPPSEFSAALPRKTLNQTAAADQMVFRQFPKSGKTRGEIGIWLSAKTVLTGAANRTVWWWLTPALWPDDEAQLKTWIHLLLNKGCRKFVLNAPWQIAFFQNPRSLSLWAGPFCNLTNPLSIDQVKSYGFSGAIVSPELGRTDYLRLPQRSSLPLGVILSGNWPLCISRILSAHLKLERVFQSPREEMAWVSRPDSNFWVYPNWHLNLAIHRKELERAGYQRFVHLAEPIGQSIKMKDRPGDWNWKIDLV
jgi:U32 family peptidase